MRISPGELSPREAWHLNERLEKVEQLLNLQVASPLTFDMRSGVPVLSIIDKTRITAKITGQLDTGDVSYSADYSADNGDSANDYADDMSCRYSFVEVRVDPNTCTPDEVKGGFVGYTNASPAVHIGGDTEVPAGSIVELWRSIDGSHWEFGSVGSGGGLVLDVVTCVSILSADDDGYSAT